MSFNDKFYNLGEPNKLWVISAIYGELSQIKTLHQTIADRIKSGDKLLYTGNYLYGNASPKPQEIITEILLFRRQILSGPNMSPDDFIYLKGLQEDLLLGKLLQIQFNVDPEKILIWIKENHPQMDIVLNGYNSSLDEGLKLSQESGSAAKLSKWVSNIRVSIRRNPGHEKFFSILKRAAFTEHQQEKNNILFVNSGIDPALPLLEQNDNFWLASKKFSQINDSYNPFKLVVRGHDPEHNGLKTSPFTLSLGKQSALCAEMSGNGDLLKIIE